MDMGWLLLSGSRRCSDKGFSLMMLSS
uniref:Uncharacterized protein n=1 Tax=Arundo donax TaxID=35708 RepID=A0A0A9BY88_ARUDO